MNPYAPPGQVPPPRPPHAAPGGQRLGAEGEVHRILHLILLIGGVLLGLLAVVVGLRRLTDAGPEPAGATEAYAAGYQLGTLLFIGWALFCIVLGPILVYGLLASRPWTLGWLRAYWLLCLFSCCFTLPAVYGLIATTRPAFRAMFGRG